MAVEVKSSGSTFEAATPQELFDSAYIGLAHSVDYLSYAVSADGQRFLIPRPTNAGDEIAAPIAVVVNWAAGVKI